MAGKSHQTFLKVENSPTTPVRLEEQSVIEETQKQSIQLQETSKRQHKNSSSISDHVKKYFEKLKKVFLHH